MTGRHAPRVHEVRAYVRADHEATRVTPESVRPAGSTADVPWQRRPIASPLARYPGHEVRTVGGPGWVGDVVVEVECDDGTTGVGVSVGGRAAAWVVEDHLARLVAGCSVDDAAEAWDRMWRGTQFYGRRGLVVHAISAVDLALWDARGRSEGRSVVDLLGGPVREEVRYYATTPDAGAARRLGFLGCKLPLPYGPAAGEAGFEADVALAEEARAALGEDLFLAYDCWMSLDVATAARLADALATVRPRWLEECLPPDDYAGMRELRARVPRAVALAGGEHEATRWGFRTLYELGACDLVQPDPTWCGGLTELLRIAEEAAARGLPLVCHGASAYALHPSAALPGVPMAECIIGSGAGDRVAPFFGGLFLDEPLPDRGAVATSRLTRPGFGLTLDPATPLVRPTRHDEPRRPS